MKNKILLDALSGIDEKYINEGTPGGRKRNGGTLAKLAVVAACLCIVVGVSLYIPYSTKKPPDNIPSAGEISDDRGNMTVDTSTEVTTNNPVDTEVHSENPAGTENQDVTTAGTTFNQDDPAIGGGNYPCNIHHTQYHMIPSELINLVGQDNITAWIESNSDETSSDSECPMLSIKQLIEVFEITEDEFIEACDPIYYPWHDINVLFNGTDAEIDAYYRNKDEIDRLGTLTDSFLDLRFEISQKYADSIKAQNIDIYSSSIPELAKLLEIEHDVLVKIINDVSSKEERLTFDYNLDMIYGTGEVQAGDVSFEPLAELLSVNEDDDPTNDISSGELDEMFCRVGRYAE